MKYFVVCLRALPPNKGRTKVAFRYCLATDRSFPSRRHAQYYVNIRNIRYFSVVPEDELPKYLGVPELIALAVMRQD